MFTDILVCEYTFLYTHSRNVYSEPKFDRGYFSGTNIAIVSASFLLSGSMIIKYVRVLLKNVRSN